MSFDPLSFHATSSRPGTWKYVRGTGSRIFEETRRAGPMQRPRGPSRLRPDARCGCWTPIPALWGRKPLWRGGGQPDAVDVPASRFLRPCAGRLAPVHPLHLVAITRGMTRAARTGRGYHLWWHPHNFGRNLEGNMAGLERIAAHFAMLRDRFGMQSLAMGDFR